MSKSLTILVDVDNVLENLNEAWVNAVNDKYDTNVSPDDIASWDIEDFPEHRFSLHYTTKTSGRHLSRLITLLII